jgi:two-component system chemotaxis response regulator CheY
MAEKDFSGIRNGSQLPEPTEVSPMTMPEMLDDYLESASNVLSELEAVALASGGSPEEDVKDRLSQVRRSIHSFKGESGIVGLDDIYCLCHETETAIEEMAQDQVSDVLIRFKDWVEAALIHISDGKYKPSRAHTSELNDSQQGSYDQSAENASAGGDDDLPDVNMDDWDSLWGQSDKGQADSGQGDAGSGDVSDSQKNGYEDKAGGGNKMRALVVEDDGACRAAVVGILSERFYCDVATDGLEGLEKFRSELEQFRKYDLVCLDINMPNMDGLEALCRIRKLESQCGIDGLDGVKIIMITVNSDSAHIFGAFRKGCEAYIIKPVDREVLYERISELELIDINGG